VVEVESCGVDIWILLGVEKMVAGWGVLAKKLAKFSSCKIFLPPAACELTHFGSWVGLTWARWAGSRGLVPSHTCSCMNYLSDSHLQM
jgi:hypothetical protein